MPVPEILHEVMVDFDFENPSHDPEKLREMLAETLIEKNGLGLAANQIGIRARAFVLATDPPVIIFNPKIIEASTETDTMKEGCLSFPGVNVAVTRPTSITVEYQNIRGELITMNFVGITARAFQHEIDHLNGVVFWERASRYHFDKAVKEFKRWSKTNATK